MPQYRMTTGAAVFCLLLAGSPVVQAAVYSSAFEALTPAPSGEYASAEFDFETSFRRIDQVSIELTVPYNLDGNYWTGNSSHVSSLTIDVFGRGGEPEFDPSLGLGAVGSQSHPNTLQVGFSPLYANVPAESRFLAPGTRLDLEHGFVGGEWPAFLFTGRGDARLYRFDLFSGWFNGGRQSYVSYSVPETPLSVRLIIDGIAVPEPMSNVILGGMLLIAFVVRRR